MDQTGALELQHLGDMKGLKWVVGLSSQVALKMERSNYLADLESMETAMAGQTNALLQEEAPAAAEGALEADNGTTAEGAEPVEDMEDLA